MTRSCILVTFNTHTCFWFYYRPKRSFGQGNIFTGVCDSVHKGRGGVCSKFSGGVCSKFSGEVCLLQIFGGVSGPGGVFQFSEYGQRSTGTHPTGVHSCLVENLQSTLHGRGKCKICK